MEKKAVPVDFCDGLQHADFDRSAAIPGAPLCNMTTSARERMEIPGFGRSKIEQKRDFV